MLSARVRSREAAVWQTLAAKERLCEELELLLRSGVGAAPVEAMPAEAQSAAARERWAALPALPAAWEKKMLARRDAALLALTDAEAAGKYLARMEQGAASRRQALLELELSLGLESPPELQPQRLALQVKQLKERFSGAAGAGAATAGEHVLAWCAQAGVAEALGPAALRADSRENRANALSYPAPVFSRAPQAGYRPRYFLESARKLSTAWKLTEPCTCSLGALAD